MSTNPVPSARPLADATARAEHASTIDLVINPAHDQPRVERPRVFYLIASAPRTGSNLLCSLLKQTGVAGVPTEYLHPVAAPRAMQHHGFPDVDAYLRDLMARRTTPNGVFGIKAHYGQLAWFLRETKTGFPLGLRAVRQYRRDIVAQAVSLYIAKRTGQWTAAHARRLGEPPEIAYDFQMLARFVAAMMKEHNQWTRFFREAGFSPQALAYETLAADPPAAALRVLDWLGIAADPATLRQARLLPKQGNARNAEWAARFRAEAAARGMSLPPPIADGAVA